jgi:hypothetical protein
MKKIKLLMLFALFTVSVNAQDYVDIFKLSLNNATLGNVDNEYETSVNNLNMKFTIRKKCLKKRFY